MPQLDVLVMTALPEEYQAAREAARAGFGEPTGARNWREEDVDNNLPYLSAEYEFVDGGVMTIALARPTRMGPRSMCPVVSALAERLRPRCLAMSGVCAGNPRAVTLGDVVVAEIAYDYSEGKQTEKGFAPDHRHIQLEPSWLRIAQDISPEDLPSYGPLAESEVRLWVLERLLEGVDPKKHPALKRYFPDNLKWRTSLGALEQEGFLERPEAEPLLTERGRTHIKRVLYDEIEAPAQLPFKVAVGPMASGAAVVKTGVTWDHLEEQGVRSILALEMEAATVATTAQTFQIPHWLVVKGVMDYADPTKDDRYKAFAAKSSAEVLFKLLRVTLHRDVTTLREPARPSSREATTIPAQTSAAAGTNANKNSERSPHPTGSARKVVPSPTGLRLQCAGHELVRRSLNGRLRLLRGAKGDPQVLVSADGTLLAHRSGANLRVARVKRTSGDTTSWVAPVDLSGLGAGEVLAVGLAGRDDLLFVWTTENGTTLYLVRRNMGESVGLAHLTDMRATSAALHGSRALLALAYDNHVSECSAFPDIDITSLVCASANGRTLALARGIDLDGAAGTWLELDGREQVRLTDTGASLVLELGTRLGPAVVGTDGNALPVPLSPRLVLGQPYAHWVGAGTARGSSYIHWRTGSRPIGRCRSPARGVMWSGAAGCWPRSSDAWVTDGWFG
jgi:nucleoside phosphorylase